MNVHIIPEQDFSSSPSSNFIPPELLHQLLSLLPTSTIRACALVSRSWNASATPFLYRDIFLRTHTRLTLLHSTFSSSPNSMHLGVHVRTLTLHRSPSFQGYAWNRDTEPSLLHPSSDENYQELNTGDKETEWLEGRVTDADLRPILSQCPNLTAVHINDCSQLTDTTITLLAKSCKPGMLQTARLALFRTITDPTFDILLSRHPKLCDLDLSLCTSLTPCSIALIADRCGASLKRLRLNSIATLTDESVRALAARVGDGLSKIEAPVGCVRHQRHGGRPDGGGCEMRGAELARYHGVWCQTVLQARSTREMGAD
ncbi:hypothetical protein BC937DRAFT_86280 [Endogone sp. FLAS-F59071]|nr:hypothetical protein BC937DRAFT_86280 [Endogone sp. FLAS-F59071]|eukprot:RUS13135.1 hypothetical protein BC937DRAFT_86280 [Endogone sp. FLAS-F59071]